MKSLIKDFFLTALLLSIFGWAGYEFFQDLNGEIRNEGGEVIGEISFIENTAQRKFSRRAVWGELEISSPLYNYDSLRTIENSRTSLTLIDGTEITMNANSYIVLEWGEESKNIEFLGGDISAAGSESSENLQIRSNNTVIALNKASVSLNKLDGEDISLSVDEGTIDVSRDGRTTSIEENYKASISDEITVEQEAVKLRSPQNNRLIVTTSASVPMEFTWDTILPLRNTRLELAEYKDFISFSDFEAPGSSAAMDIIPGTYYWRISGTFPDGTAYSSPSNRVVIIRDNAPSQQVPVPDEVFEYRNIPPDMAFSWEASALANGSVLQVASDAGFTSVAREISGPNNFSTLQGLTEGTWYWRVLPQYSSARLIAYSSPEIRRFSIVKNDSLEPPRLILPAPDESVNPLKLREGLRFSWKADREIGSYHLVVASDSEMNAPIVDQWLSRNSFLMEELPPVGDYYWMVEGLDRENRAVPPSPVRRFDVLEAVLSINTLRPAAESLNIVESFDNIPFAWESTLEGPYRVEVFRDGSGGTPLFSQTSNALSMNLVLPGAGKYSWQASAVDSGGNTVIASTQTPFEMVYRLSTPRFTEPDEGEALSLLGSTPLTIEWQPVGGAQYYSAELIPRDPAYPTLTREASPDTTWTISDKSLLNTGVYTLQVQAHQRLENGVINSSASAIRSFSLDRLLDYQAPRLTYPANGQRLSKLVLIENQPSFRWIQTPTLPRQKIRLSRDPNFSSLILDEERSVLSRRIPDLDTGVYYLQLSSRDDEGNSSPDSAIYSFEVTPVPPLPAVTSFQPLPGETLDMQTRDSLDFNWSAVPGTSYYRITLSSAETGKTVFKEDKWSGTNYNFSKLEDLDVGAFRFDVQAVRELDGRVFQESSVLSVPFQLTLPEIDEIPDILSPELQYAR